MRAPRTERVLVLCACVLFCLGEMTVSGQNAASRNWSPEHEDASHHPRLTDAQRADQNVRFMMSLYRSAAEPDGRPRQHRKFGSNTVRLLTPSAAMVHHLPASGDHHYTFRVQYNLDTLPSEQLIKASFVHLRSASSVGPAPDGQLPPPPPHCSARVASLGPEGVATLEPHQHWAETDITGHVLRRRERDGGAHLTLTAQYWCSHAPPANDSSPWWRGGRTRLRRREDAHLEVPSLLLYLEEAREGKDWMAELLGDKGRSIMRQIGRWHPAVRRRRRRRSKDPAPSKDARLDALRNAPASLFSSSPSAAAAAVPNAATKYRRKTEPPQNGCKLHSYIISFNQLDWGHFFIFPPNYNPRFCKGDCPKVLHNGYHSPMHAVVQTLISDLGIGDVPPPSCVPYKYMPLSVLVMNNKEKLEYKELADMMAESCTCR